jgi:hypothetical protein
MARFGSDSAHFGATGGVAAARTATDGQVSIRRPGCCIPLREPRSRALVVGVAAGANAAAAWPAGRDSSTSTVTTPRGRTCEVHTTGCSPTAAAIAQSNAAAQNEAMIGATIERGRQNMAALERTVIKDNTLRPGEWYGGALHIAPLVSTDETSKSCTITIEVGADRHDILVAQGPAAQS